MVLTNDFFFFLSVWEWDLKALPPPPHRHPCASELDSGFIPRQPSHNSPLFGLFMLLIYFVCGNISPTLSSLNVKNTNAPPTRHQSLSLAPTHSLAVSIYGFFFIFFLTFLRHERPSVFPTRSTYVHGHTLSLSLAAPQSCPNRMIGKSNKTPTVFQSEGVCAEQRRDKKEKGIKKKKEGAGGEEEEEEWTRGIVRPRESSPQKQKQLWVRTHSEERLAGTHPPRHSTTITTTAATPAEKELWLQFSGTWHSPWYLSCASGALAWFPVL